MILAFDSSTSVTVIAVGEAGQAEPRAAHRERTGGANQASNWLHERIGEAMAAAGTEFSALSCVAVGRGPGMFTGSRVAVATAKGLCLGAGVPALPLSTLAILGADRADANVLCLLDARRGEVYSLLLHMGADGYHHAGPERCSPVETVLAQMPAGTRLVGPGVPAYAQRIQAWRAASGDPDPGNEEADAGDSEVSVAGLWAAARARLRHSKPANASALEVVYLRQSYAEMGLNVPKRPVTRSPFLHET